MRPPHYYSQFFLSLGKAFPYIFSKFHPDPLTCVLTRFDGTFLSRRVSLGDFSLSRWSLVFHSSHRFSSTSRVLSIPFHSSFSNSLIIHKENRKDECLEILSWTTKKLTKTLSRPLHSKLKKIRGLFKDLLKKMEKWILRTRPRIHTCEQRPFDLPR